MNFYLAEFGLNMQYPYNGLPLDIIWTWKLNIEGGSLRWVGLGGWGWGLLNGATAADVEKP